MKGIKIKETYLLFLIVIGLVSLAVYTTYALFTTSTEIEDVVEFTTTLSTNNSIIEYEMVTVPAGDTKIVELNITNSYNQTLYYGAWYEMISPSAKTDDIELGLYTDKNNTASSGTITSGTTKKLLVGITNNTSSSIMLNIGTIGSATSNLGLASTRTLLPTGWSETLVVTDEVLEEYATTTTKTINNSYSYTGAVQNVTLNPGTYKLEVWGAQGGSYNTTYAGGKGGYSYGTLTLTEKTNLFVYVGGQGAGGTTTGTKAGGFNGGGSSYASSTTYAGGSGGGASDIRIGQDDLYARAIVAGGGGGSGSYNASNRYTGGVGGGASGGTGSQYSTSYKAGTGGSATARGNSYYGSTSNSTTYGTLAAFGTGGGSKSTSYNGIAGGGGGWYGGGYARRAPGGGGSGYVYTSSTASNYPSGCLLNSSYYLTSAATVAGNTSFTDYSGSAATGHSGNGNAKITGTEQIKVYTIPRLTGLTDLELMLGDNYDLTSDVTLICENGATGCSIVGTDITNTSTLALGTYTINYTIKDSNNKRYIYQRKLIIAEGLKENATSAEVIKYLGLNGSVKTGTPTFSTKATTDEGIYTTQDDLGNTYYFRGAVTNNYVKFGKNSSNQDMYWRIVRINGNGTIRMIYDGTQAHSNGTSSTNRVTSTTAYSQELNYKSYVGYMRSYDDVSYINEEDSIIKTYTDQWYRNNIYNTGYNDYVADAIYCNDRKESGTGNSITYGATARTYDGTSPSLKCSQANDRFTMPSSTLAPTDGAGTNGDLTYPVGLITADEVMMAGAIANTANNSYYLYTGNNYWTMSPLAFYNSEVLILIVSSNGGITEEMGNRGSTVPYIRPVISLKANVLKYNATTSNGSKENPFVLK